MSTYYSCSVYRPQGCGYVIKGKTKNKKTEYVHKTYASIPGVRHFLSSVFTESETYYIYKIPDDSLVGIAERKRFRFISDIDESERKNYIEKAGSFYDPIT